MPVVDTTKLLKSVLHEVVIMDSELLEMLVEEVGLDRVFMLLFAKPNAALKSFLRALENYEVLWKITSGRLHTVNETKEKVQALLGGAEKAVCSVSEPCIANVVKELGLHRVLPLLLGKQCCTVNNDGVNENTVQGKRVDCGAKSCSDSKGCSWCDGQGKPEQSAEREERVKDKVCIVGLRSEQLVPCICEIRVTREGVPCEWCGGTGLLTKAVKQLVKDNQILLSTLRDL